MALQQLLVVVIVWVHGAIGLYSTLVLRPVWTRLANDAGWRALVEQNLQVLQELGHRLHVIEAGISGAQLYER